ncbi:hypothetical protein [Sinorhizobium sp. BG8]|uniref:hypothetical protein n=1 Tax=Sinorhizobium sp. BG8 TaxID=2613773 RepID=UPI0032B2E4B6
MVAKLLVLGSALLATMGSLPVFAADQEEIIDAPEIDIASTAASAQGWYVRGDVGYAAWIKGDRPKANDNQPFVITPGSFDDARFSRPVSVGLGVGYQFNDTFRADFTADIYQGDLDGHTSTAQPCSGPSREGPRAATPRTPPIRPPP